MKNEIHLVFDKSTTRLVGNPYGKTVYKQQVKEKLDFTKKNVIMFPNNIVKVASSFTQGLFSEIIGLIGYSGVEKMIEIETGNEELTKNMYEDLYY